MKKLCVGNWKMNCNKKTISDIDVAQARLMSVEIGMAVPYVYIGAARVAFGDAIVLCAQDCSQFKKGAYTGEVSAEMLKESGVERVVLGHSERRSLFRDDSKVLAQKVANCVEASLDVVYCVGETLEQRESKRTIEVITEQLSILRGVRGLHAVDVAYEPVWAIGTGKSATAEDIGVVVGRIKRDLEAFNLAGRVLYGGSVNKACCKELSVIESLDGFLVGNASLTNELFEIAQSLDS